ncbi:hypothetical protein ACH5RR_023115 [Cinchona calisaya]|uniref:Uncharacterized protein n=1 Tax=Cinchona calisaya TaxID=153742 RepID=A0ABD2ZER1_9GENT
MTIATPLHSIVPIIEVPSPSILLAKTNRKLLICLLFLPPSCQPPYISHEVPTEQGKLHKLNGTVKYFKGKLKEVEDQDTQARLEKESLEKRLKLHEEHLKEMCNLYSQMIEKMQEQHVDDLTQVILGNWYNANS